MTEFLPVSSSGHLVIVSSMFGITNVGVLFESILHLGTTFAILYYFRSKLSELNMQIIKYLVIASIPAAAVGLLFQGLIEDLFTSLSIVGFALFVTATLNFYIDRLRSLPQSFKYAGNGIKIALKNEPNFRIHTTFAVTALFLAIVLDFSKYDWLLLLFTISFVLIMELFNTVLESIVNMVSPEVQPYAKIAKDVAAAAVLLSAGVAVAVGAVLFLPKVLFILGY